MRDETPAVLLSHYTYALTCDALPTFVRLHVNAGPFSDG